MNSDEQYSLRTVTPGTHQSPAIFFARTIRAAVRMPARSYRIWLAVSIVLFAPYTSTATASDIGDNAALITKTLKYTCKDPSGLSGALNGALGARESAPAEPINFRGADVGERLSFETPNHRFTIERLRRDKKLTGVRIFLYDLDKNPLFFVGADDKCQVRMASRIEYDRPGHASALQILRPDLKPSGIPQLLDPPVPAGRDPGGVRVAMVDAGVNYLLPSITPRLARNSTNDLIGYDYWDMDPRPFDNHPVPSVFFTQRHGTRTAGLLLQQSPVASLVPYRYPRSNMKRMRELIEHAYQNKVRIVGMPLGGKKETEWQDFAAAASSHPEMLFIASAGNSGQDIDQHPVYPASLKLANLLVVSSADDDILPAEGTNWGHRTVHLLVPAEDQDVIDFDGHNKKVSGSSYAVSRIAALAALISAKHPEWDGRKIHKAILDRALRLPHLEKYVSVGYLPDPQFRADEINITAKNIINVPQTRADLFLQLDLILLSGSGWPIQAVTQMLERANELLAQCSVGLGPIMLSETEVAPRLLDFDVHTAHSLVNQFTRNSVAVYLTRDTKRQNGFEGEAFGRGNSQTRPWLTNTVWLVADIHQPAMALAHELFHVVSNSGMHSNVNDNLMNTRTKPSATKLSEQQCQALRSNGKERRLLLPAKGQ